MTTVYAVIVMPDEGSDTIRDITLFRTHGEATVYANDLRRGEIKLDAECDGDDGYNAEVFAVDLPEKED